MTVIKAKKWPPQSLQSSASQPTSHTTPVPFTLLFKVKDEGIKYMFRVRHTLNSNLDFSTF
jgi:hypothetical protein